MVDEFQDRTAFSARDRRPGRASRADRGLHTGDEFQSIYGFRHADVEVFRERRAQAANLLTLRSNYRSRPQVLGTANSSLVLSATSTSHLPRRPSSRIRCSVTPELMVTDKSNYRDRRVPAATGSAGIVRTRRELVDAGAALGEIVVLRGWDGRRAVRRSAPLEGLCTYRATGRGYFGQQQVVDLLTYLRLLHNRYDDVALATVLASPLRRGLERHARPASAQCNGDRSSPQSRRPARRARGRGRKPLRAFLQRYDRLVAASTRVSLERLCEQVLAEHDYDLAVLARWDGSRRFANLRKLGRLARQHEAIRGAESGFVRFVREQDGARRERARSGCGRGRRRRRPPAHHPWREGPRVQGRDRRRRGARRRGPGRRRDRRALRRRFGFP